jgi:cell division protein FtsW
MTHIRPPRPTPTDASGRPPAAVVAVRKLFGTDNGDALLLLGVTIFLVIFGLVMVLSASFVISGRAGNGDFFGIFLRQGLFALVGIPVMLMIGRLPAIFWRRWARHLVILGVGLQALVVFTPLGYEYGGNRNWLYIGGFTAQPSEFLKLALAVWLATVLADKADGLHTWKDIIFPALPLSFASIGMVLVGDDLGTAGVMLAMVLGALYFAGAPIGRMIVLVGALAMLAVTFAFSSPSRTSRITVWVDGCRPEDYEGVCWQVVHGTWALGSGGLFGVGLGNSSAKWSWLPHAESDFIFAIIGEELGFVGALVVLALFVALAIALVRLVRSQDDPFRRIAIGAIMTWLVVQSFVNIAVVLGMLPVLGVPLPFISAGGSSLVATLLAVGVVLSVSRDAPSVEAGR